MIFCEENITPYKFRTNNIFTLQNEIDHSNVLKLKYLLQIIISMFLFYLNILTFLKIYINSLLFK